MRKAILLLVSTSLAASPLHAVPKRPLVGGANGQAWQLQPGQTLQLQPSTSGGAALNVPHGTPPSSPTNGDCWTTTAGLFCQISGLPVKQGPDAILATSLSGVDATGTTSSVAGLRAGCLALNARGGGTLVIPNGTYKIDSTIDCSSAPYAMSSNWTIEFSSGARLLATSSLSTSVLKIFSGTAKTYTLDVIRPNINVASATCDATCQGGQGVTALEVQDMQRATIYSPNLVGGTSYSNVNSNNGITCTRTPTTQVFGGVISGFPNGGIYCVGDLAANSPNDYSLGVYGTYFSHNNTAVECKFSLSACIVQGSMFDYNRYAMTTWRAGANNSEPSALYYNFSGNVARHTQVSAVWAQADSKGIIANNYFSDVGYSESNVLTHSGTQFINLDGAANAVITGNRMDLKDWANSGFLGIVALQKTFNGNLFPGGSHTLSGNSFRNISYGFYEGPSVTSSSVSGMDAPAAMTAVCSLTNSGSTCGIANAFAVASLPTCAGGRKNTTARATDLNATTFFSIAAGGGSNSLGVVCDGANWRIGQ